MARPSTLKIVSGTILLTAAIVYTPLGPLLLKTGNAAVTLCRSRVIPRGDFLGSIPEFAQGIQDLI